MASGKRTSNFGSSMVDPKKGAGCGKMQGDGDVHMSHENNFNYRFGSYQ